MTRNPWSDCSASDRHFRHVARQLPVLIGHADILSTLFGRVVIPNAVFVELQRPGTSAIVRDWVANPPNWLEVRSATRAAPELKLGAGETEAIMLAEELQANLLLIDDKLARSTAEAHGFNVAGTINVLQAAAARDLLSLPKAIALLRQTTFHVSEKILQHALDADAQHKTKTRPVNDPGAPSG